MDWEFSKKDVKFIKCKIFDLSKRIDQAEPGSRRMESLQRERRIYAFALDEATKIMYNDALDMKMLIV